VILRKKHKELKLRQEEGKKKWIMRERRGRRRGKSGAKSSSTLGEEEVLLREDDPDRLRVTLIISPRPEGNNGGLLLNLRTKNPLRGKRKSGNNPKGGGATRFGKRKQAVLGSLTLRPGSVSLESVSAGGKRTFEEGRRRSSKSKPRGSNTRGEEKSCVSSIHRKRRKSTATVRPSGGKGCQKKRKRSPADTFR